MPHARLEFELPALPEPGPHGAEQVQLVFSGPGSDLAPLSKVASGDELSRVRLALEAVLADGAQDASERPLLHSFVFDEGSMPASVVRLPWRSGVGWPGWRRDRR